MHRSTHSAPTPKPHRQQIGDVAGWYGAVAFLLAYGLVSFNIIVATSLLFHAMNLTGAVALMVMSSIKNVRQTLLLNTIWSLIALAAIYRLLLT